MRSCIAIPKEFEWDRLGRTTRVIFFALRETEEGRGRTKLLEPPLTIKGCAMRQNVFCLFSRFQGFLAERLPSDHVALGGLRSRCHTLLPFCLCLNQFLHFVRVSVLVFCWIEGIRHSLNQFDGKRYLAR